MAKNPFLFACDRTRVSHHTFYYFGLVRSCEQIRRSYRTIETRSSGYDPVWRGKVQIFDFGLCSTILPHDELLLACPPPPANPLPQQRPGGSPYGVWRLGGRFQLQKVHVAVEIDLFLPFLLLVTGSDPDPPWPRRPVRIVHRTGHASSPTHGMAPVQIAAAIAHAVCSSLGDGM